MAEIIRMSEAINESSRPIRVKGSSYDERFSDQNISFAVGMLMGLIGGELKEVMIEWQKWLNESEMKMRDVSMAATKSAVLSTGISSLGKATASGAGGLARVGEVGVMTKGARTQMVTSDQFTTGTAPGRGVAGGDRPVNINQAEEWLHAAANPGAVGGAQPPAPAAIANNQDYLKMEVESLRKAKDEALDKVNTTISSNKSIADGLAKMAELGSEGLRGTGEMNNTMQSTIAQMESQNASNFENNKQAVISTYKEALSSAGELGRTGSRIAGG